MKKFRCLCLIALLSASGCAAQEESKVATYTATVTEVAADSVSAAIDESDTDTQGAMTDAVIGSDVPIISGNRMISAEELSCSDRILLTYRDGELSAVQVIDEKTEPDGQMPPAEGELPEDAAEFGEGGMQEPMQDGMFPSMPDENMSGTENSNQ